MMFPGGRLSFNGEMGKGGWGRTQRRPPAPSWNPAPRVGQHLTGEVPGISGEETLRRLRAVRPDVPVVLSRGFGEVEAARRFADQGLAGFLHKPYNVATLAEKVRTVIAANAAGG